jgi:hypothetical protein
LVAGKVKGSEVRLVVQRLLPISKKAAKPLMVLRPGFFDGSSLLRPCQHFADPMGQVIEIRFTADLGLYAGQRGFRVAPTLAVQKGLGFEHSEEGVTSHFCFSSDITLFIFVLTSTVMLPRAT